MERSGPNEHYGSVSPSSAVCLDTVTLHCFSAGQTGISAASASIRLYDTWYRDYGAYAQGSYKFSDHFTVTAGARYTWDWTKQTGRHVNLTGLPKFVDTTQVTGTCLDVLTFGLPNTPTNTNRTADQCASSFVQK